MEFLKALKKPFTDVKKLIIGILLSIIPIVNWFAKGFILESSGVKQKKNPGEMPEWKDFGGLFLKGFLSWVIGIIYMIPALIIFIIAIGTALASLASVYLGQIIPAGTIESVAVGETTPEVLQALIQQNWVQAIPALFAAAPVMIVAGLVALLAAYLIPVAVLNYIKEDKFGSAFSCRIIFKKAFTGAYFAAWILSGIVLVILGIILQWIPIIGMAAAFFIAGVIGYSLMGEAFKKA